MQGKGRRGRGLWGENGGGGIQWPRVLLGDRNILERPDLKSIFNRRSTSHETRQLVP